MYHWRERDKWADGLPSLLKRKSEKRYAEGRKEHGHLFIGDPLDHADEEQYDGFFYLYAARKERTYLRQVILVLSIVSATLLAEVIKMKRKENSGK